MNDHRPRRGRLSVRVDASMTTIDKIRSRLAGYLDCFAFGLSSSCRLAVIYRGDMPVKWTVESLEDGRWTADSTTGLLFQPFWRPARLVHLQNSLFDGER